MHRRRRRRDRTREWCCLNGKNNASKATILRVYELAKGSIQLDENKGRCLHAPWDNPSEVLLEIHIPDGR